MTEIVLFQPPARPWGTPNVSPFCAKLETYLRIAEVPYSTAKFGRGEAPNGKIPYIRIDGALLGDSQLILEELERRRVADGKPALDAGLTPHELALARVTRRMLEEAFHYTMIYARWKTNDGFARVREAFTFVPGFVMPFVRRAMVKKIGQQGTGLHAEADVMAMGARDLESVSELLGDKPFFLGDAPRTIDATVFAYVEGVLAFPLDTPIKRAVLARPNLVAYRDRVRARWWKDLPQA